MGFLFQQTSILFTVLLIAAIATLFSERVGCINISINGNMIIGCLLFALFGFYCNKNNHLGQWSQLIALLLAMIGTAVFSLIYACAIITFQTNQIVTGTAVNVFALSIGGFLVLMPQSVSGQYPTNFNLYGLDQHKIIHLYLLLAVVITIIAVVFFKYTRHGLRWTALGENPTAVYLSGSNILKIRYLAVIISGLLSGFSGVVFSFSFNNNFVGNVQGQGFVALAIMIAGQWKIYFIILGSLLFSFLHALVDWLPFNSQNNFATNNHYLLKMIPFIVAILVMLFFNKKQYGPKVIGQPFNLKSQQRGDG